MWGLSVILESQYRSRTLTLVYRIIYLMDRAAGLHHPQGAPDIFCAAILVCRTNLFHSCGAFLCTTVTHFHAAFCLKYFLCYFRERDAGTALLCYPP